MQKYVTVLYSVSCYWYAPIIPFPFHSRFHARMQRVWWMEDCSRVDLSNVGNNDRPHFLISGHNNAEPGNAIFIRFHLHVSWRENK